MRESGIGMRVLNRNEGKWNENRNRNEDTPHYSPLVPDTSVITICEATAGNNYTKILTQLFTVP